MVVKNGWQKVEIRAVVQRILAYVGPTLYKCSWLRKHWPNVCPMSVFWLG